MEEQFIKCPQCGQEIAENALQPHLRVFCLGKPEEDAIDALIAAAEAVNPDPNPDPNWRATVRDFSSQYKLLSKLNRTVVFFGDECVYTQKLDINGSPVRLSLLEAGVQAGKFISNPKDLSKEKALSFGLGEDGAVTALRPGFSRKLSSVPSTSADAADVALPTSGDWWRVTWLVPNSKWFKFLPTCVVNDLRIDFRPVLTSVLFSFDGESLSLVAADGFRLAMTPPMPIAGNNGKVDMLVPAAAVTALTALTGSDLIVDFVNGDSSKGTPSIVRFGGDNGFVTCRLVEGTFPAYKTVILRPMDREAQTVSFMVQSKLLIEQVKSFGDPKDYSGVGIALEESKLTLRRWDGEEAGVNKFGGDAQLDVVSARGSGSITVNATYLLDGLRDEMVTIGWIDSKSPLHIKSDVDYVVMPMARKEKEDDTTGEGS